MPFKGELLALINQHLNKGKSGKKSAVYVTEKTGGLTYFSCGIFGLRKALDVSKKNTIKILLTRTKEKNLFQINKKFIIRKSLNGAIVINYTNNEVVKFCDKFLEPNFITNELKAQKILPNNTPQILSHGVSGDYNYIVTALYPKQRTVKWAVWAEELNKLKPVLDEFYQKNQLIKLNAQEYVGQVVKNLESVKIGHQYLSEIFNEVYALLIACLNKHQKLNVPLYKAFSHGDLVPNNIIITKNNVFICDWMNGGEQNLFYDLMLQYFYFPNHNIWKEFNYVFKDEKFDWWLSLFFNHYGLKFTNEQIRLSFIISLAEIGLKNFLRYQSAEEFADGEGMLVNIKEITSQILA